MREQPRKFITDVDGVDKHEPFYLNGKHKWSMAKEHLTTNNFLYFSDLLKTWKKKAKKNKKIDEVYHFLSLLNCKYQIIFNVTYRIITIIFILPY